MYVHTIQKLNNVVTSITGRALYGSTFSTGAVAGNLNLTVAYIMYNVMYIESQDITIFH